MEESTTVPVQALERVPDGDPAMPGIGQSIAMHAQPGNGQMNAEGEDEATRLRALATHVRNQDDLERDIGRQVSPPR